MARDWSRGLTAETDPRIARSAAGHRGKRYARHKPLELDRRLRGRRLLPLEWSQETAYVVGLLATDGWLSRDRRHIVLTSKDLD